MKKIGYGSAGVFVTLTPAEFSGLTGKSYSNVPDGTDISLARVKQLANLVKDNKSQLQQIAADAVVLSQTITELVG
jgi:hypothetical protein